MKNTRFLAIVLAMLMLLTLFAGCSKENTTTDPTNEAVPTGESDVEMPTIADVIPTEEQTQATEKEDDNALSSVDDSEFVVNKLGTIENKGSYFYKELGGAYYKDDNDMYGIISRDGSKDTGAVYTNVEAEYDNAFFVVSQKKDADVTSVADLNSSGLLNDDLQLVVPMEYAAIDILSDRFVKVCEVTEQTDNKDEALVYYTDSMISITASDDDTFFKGNWYVYDILKGAKVPGISGTQAYYIDVYGSYIEYIDEAANDYVIKNADGETVTGEFEVFEDGTLLVAEGNKGTVYNPDNTKAFSFEVDGYIPYERLENGHFAAVREENDGMTFVILDGEGKAVSKEFAIERRYDVEVFGEVIVVNGQLFDYNGNSVIEGTYDDIYYEDIFGKYLMLENYEGFTMIQTDGTVLYKGAESENLEINEYSFAIRRKDDSGYKYYNVKDQDFTLEGYSAGVVHVSADGANGTENLVNTVTGEVALKNYSDYEVIEIEGEGLLVYAEALDGSYDVYTIK